ncbi:LpqN/LpqT family lipoprotein [Mycolicibacterium brumae]|uniref:Lipoprotein LpqN n=1 Tax=Mycolicibacterium brumae TaxID=85968 RepID=A0A2G5P6L7_9MYCO|nr:LpqN/LpqT family lipoprotein [Mycolicibacterium brumae]MCV7194290.1 LpqN/LpqT family lipoprotein [Mycolicibacterium brumae]PIB73916.1 hypothetical protein CQY22_014930 [Mycolicibacterium brumae]RWA20278.1 hypothetical protein MBRU_15530 [Mycolicibacterium brumae DSM 44177]UWW09643.1 LpqN/LpqT family lipoprotein [Mycolicibacterium brumae]
MGGLARSAAAVLLGAALALAGCSSGDTPADSTSSAPAEPNSAPDDCADVAVPLLVLAPQNASEPTIALPVPPGWDRNTSLDGNLVRAMIGRPGAGPQDFAPNAMVTFGEVVGRAQTPEDLIDGELAGLQKSGITIEASEPAQVCGLQARRVAYTKNGRPVTAVIVGAVHDDKHFSIALTVGTPENATADDAADRDTIVNGFRVYF